MDAKLPSSPLARSNIARLGTAFWVVVVLGALFSLARFSEAFLLLRAQSLGLSLAWVPAVLVVMNVVFALSAWPAGALSDSVGRYGLLAARICRAHRRRSRARFRNQYRNRDAGDGVVGPAYGLDPGNPAALIADAAPADLRGTAFGMFNLVTGVAMLLASVVAGALWDIAGAQMTFLAGAALTALAFGVLPFVRAMLSSAVPAPRAR